MKSMVTTTQTTSSTTTATTTPMGRLQRTLVRRQQHCAHDSLSTIPFYNWTLQRVDFNVAQWGEYHPSKWRHNRNWNKFHLNRISTNDNLVCVQIPVWHTNSIRIMHTWVGSNDTAIHLFGHTRRCLCANGLCTSAHPGYEARGRGRFIFGGFLIWLSVGVASRFFSSFSKCLVGIFYQFKFVVGYSRLILCVCQCDAPDGATGISGRYPRLAGESKLRNLRVCFGTTLPRLYSAS